MKRLFFVVFLSGCYAEWEIPVTPRRDPCTNIVESAVIYVQPTCPVMPRRHPKDNDR